MRIGIDPGHGGIDPGAVSPIRAGLNDELYTEEKEITLDIAKRIQGILLACGHEIIMTRIADQDKSLFQRSRLLNDVKCDVAISIHLNAASNSTANYVASFIQAFGGYAEKLAKCIQPCLVKNTGWADGGIRVANFHMTRETDMPAVLLELGFISNPEEEKQLNCLDFKCKLAIAIAEGVMNFIGSISNWQQRLLDYAVDVPAGRAEIARAQQVYQEKAIIGDNDGAAAAHRWAEQIRLATGISL